MILPATGSDGLGVTVGDATAIGVEVAHTQLALVVHDGFLHAPPEQVIELGQSVLVEQVLPHCAIGVGVGVGVADAHIQLVLVVHDGFLQLPTEHTIELGQSEFVVHVVPHCGTGVGVGVAETVGVGVGVAVGDPDGTTNVNANV